MERNGGEDHGKGCRATDLTEHTGTDHELLANGEQFLLFWNFDRKVRRDHIGNLICIIDLLDRVQNL